MLPNVAPQMLIVASYEFGQIVLLEASLSYLGLGVQPPLPSWGAMVADGQTYLALAPSLSILPSLALFVLISGSTDPFAGLHGRERCHGRRQGVAGMSDLVLDVRNLSVEVPGDNGSGPARGGRLLFRAPGRSVRSGR